MSLKLINAIADGEITLSELTKEDLVEMSYASVANCDFRALRIAANEFTGLYNYDDHKPYWLCSDFKAPLWKIEINIGEGKEPMNLTIDWQAVVLDDRKPLTSPCHAPLLLAFKYWVTATDNPLHNGGRQIKGAVVALKIYSVRTLINSILLHSSFLKLSELHLAGLTQEFLLDIFVKLAKAGDIADGLYNHTERVTGLLRQHLTSISDDEASRFTAEYPYITRNLADDEQRLGLSLNERIKACCWLHSINFYHRRSKTKDGKTTTKFMPNGYQYAFLPYFYDGKILPIAMNLSIINELRLKPEEANTEYRAVPNKDNSKEMGEGRLIQFFQVLPLLHSFRDKKGVSLCPLNALDGISLKRIQQHATIKSTGRFKTLPPKMVFNLIRQAYEFTIKYQDVILDSVLSVLVEAQTKSTTAYSNPNYIDSRRKEHNPDIGSSERQEWFRTQAQELIAPELNSLGVKGIHLSSNTDDVFFRRRDTPSIFDLYSVLIGSIQSLIGVITAKRQDELINLKSYGNLVPNIDPASEKGQQSEFFLKAKLKKSGSGGKSERNATIKRPIPHAFALLIWRLEQFNQAMTKGKCNRHTLSLFNTIEHHTMKATRCARKSYNARLDAMCDYFETPLVDFGGEDLRRYYVRQHQLRRFFAMVFFWSKGFDGLDSLRWMLGHTDIEHLHNYITESEPGEVLNGVKASYLCDAIENNKLKNIDRLRELIAKRYSVNTSDISLNSVTDAGAIYDDDADYKTIPQIGELRKQEQLESHILELLNDNVISLEPEFFSIYQKNRKINDFSLSLQINELD
ncbi:integrase [Aliivibrio salmonicida]|uniref:integrase n=1 Tax=Aliivibrio salmonicida TaxID=40269 RepID=UPI00406D009B